MVLKLQNQKYGVRSTWIEVLGGTILVIAAGAFLFLAFSSMTW